MNKKTIMIVMAAILTALGIAGTQVYFDTNQPDINTKEKNPHIQYFEDHTIKISGNNSTELAKNLGEARKECWVGDISTVPEHIDQFGNITNSLVGRTDSCGEKFK